MRNKYQQLALGPGTGHWTSLGFRVFPSAEWKADYVSVRALSAPNQSLFNSSSAQVETRIRWTVHVGVPEAVRGTRRRLQTMVEEGSVHGEAHSPLGASVPTCDLMGRIWEGTVRIKTQ